MKFLEVFIAACQPDIAAGLRNASQHAQVAYACRLAIDVHAPYAPAAHAHHLSLLAVFAGDHLACSAPGLLGQKKRGFAEKGEGNIARPPYITAPFPHPPLPPPPPPR